MQSQLCLVATNSRGDNAWALYEQADPARWQRQDMRTSGKPFAWR